MTRWQKPNPLRKEGQGQNQRKAQEASHQGRHAQKDQDGQEKAGEKGVGPASITRESQADREGRSQADASPPAGAGRSNQPAITPPHDLVAAGACDLRIGWDV
jgi:hypothetical protein